MGLYGSSDSNMITSLGFIVQDTDCTRDLVNRETRPILEIEESAWIKRLLPELNEENIVIIAFVGSVILVVIVSIIIVCCIRCRRQSKAAKVHVLNKEQEQVPADTMPTRCDSAIQK